MGQGVAAGHAILPQPATRVRYAGVLAAALTVVLTAILILLADPQSFFVDDALPMGDAASNDVLIADAKHLNLLHGNYSRVGFYHPGPFYLQWFALVELVLVDAAGLLASPLAAQHVGLIVLHAAAFGLCLFTWSRWAGRPGPALLAVAVTAAVMLWGAGTDYLIEPWPPHMYIASALVVASATIGLLVQGARWAPWLVLGGLQLVHGHASFIGILPVMLLVGAGTAMGVGVLPRRRPDAAALRAMLRRHRRVTLASAAIAAVFLAPIVLHTLRTWPGELEAYLGFAQVPGSHGPAAAARYVVSFLPAYGIWLLLFLLPAPRDGQPSGRVAYRDVGIVLTAIACVPAWLYAWRGIDTLQERYLIYWILPFAGSALAACLLHTAALLPAHGRRILLAAATVASLWVLRPLVPPPASAFEAERARRAHEVALTHAAADWLAAQSEPGHRLALQLDTHPEAWGPAWTATISVLAAMRRQGLETPCVDQASWHLLFHARNRCDPADVTRRLTVTTPERAPDGWIVELPGRHGVSVANAVVRLPGVPAIGTTVDAATLVGSGITLQSGWWRPEEWGVWSDGPRAALAIDGSRLPGRFRVEIVWRLFPPLAVGPQTVRIEDGGGRLMAELSNAVSSGTTIVAVDRTAAGASDIVTLHFLVERPISPRDLRMSRDARRLGIGLERITILE